MRAFVCENYGPPEVLELRHVDKPVPKPDQVLIKVHATTVNAADCNTRGLSYVPARLGFVAKMMLGFRKPRIRIHGSVLAGVIEAVGTEVKSFKPGNEVFGTGPELGAYAEYVCRPANGALAIKPVGISFEEAAAIPYGGLTALHFLRDVAHIQPGQKVLINGASGGVGVNAVQLARYFGAEVTGVCSTANLKLVHSLGAAKVIDYTKEDAARANGQWDIIMDIVVGKTSFKRFKNSLTPQGKYLAVAGGLKDLLGMIRTSLGRGKKVIFGGGSECEKQENLEFLSRLVEKGELKPVMDKSFPFEQLAEAHRYTESGSKHGNVTIRIL